VSSIDSTFSQINPQKLQSLTINNTGKTSILKNEIIDFVLKDIQKIPNYYNLKNDIEILLHICNLVENLISKNKGAIDKKQLVIDIICQVFCISSDAEKDAVAKQIQFLYDNKLIKKISSFLAFKKKLTSLVKIT